MSIVYRRTNSAFAPHKRSSSLVFEMDLRERLKGLKRQSDSPPPSPRRNTPLPYLSSLENEYGYTYYCDKIYIDYHGQIDLKNFPDISSDTIRFLALDRKLPDLNLHNSVFLDIETTGTAGGTGTIAFLVG